ncbi:chymotrypsin inhibitor-like [Hylaeus volcanicus]|uniref:chymotrypsin inhibitor-like n=1 Tax=Hylaeus volcanicus TaxID=313075 RepID=UPI0023B7CB8B|nr:chymotrypsin inhibitor-like [Hylaeus volcanicus]
MSRAIVLFLVVVAVAYTAAFPEGQEASQECGPNEVFNACGSACVDTCERRATPVCTMNCVVGCQCMDGYVRNKENKCVLTRDC